MSSLNTPLSIQLYADSIRRFEKHARTRDYLIQAFIVIYRLISISHEKLYLQYIVGNNISLYFESGLNVWICRRMVRTI